jgi:hypothetical protein
MSMLIALLGEAIAFGKPSGACENERSARLDRAEVPLAQLALRQHEQARLARRRAQQRHAPLGIAHLERRPSPAQPREQPLGREFGIPGDVVPLAVLGDPCVDQLRDAAVRGGADGGDIDQPREGMQPRREVARGVRGQPRQRVVALQFLGADAPDPAADLAPALGVAHARIVPVALDAVGRAIAQAHAVERIGAPRLHDRVRPWRPLRGGGRSQVSAPAAG